MIKQGKNISTLIIENQYFPLKELIEHLIILEII